ncbi:MAG: FAD-dependent oxidoreductase, partial [Pseudomonadota bacterium]
METFDLVVTGGGIFGLWVAKHAVDVGLSVLVAEKDTIGAGASGGLLGALMPHIPTGWNEKKQFQFDALYELSEEVAALEEATGCETGYGRVGRLMPLRAERFCALADDRGKAAREVWHQRERTFDFARGGDQRFYSWLSTDYAPYGYVHDTFAARVRPVDYLAALKAYLEPRATITEGLAFDRFREGQASFNGGARQVRAGAIALAHGYQTFDYLNNHHA